MVITRGVAVLLTAAILLSACATQPMADVYDPPGFLLGLVHGAVAPFALVGSVLMEVRIYAFPNSGWGYDCGFLLGLAFVWGGAVASA